MNKITGNIEESQGFLTDYSAKDATWDKWRAKTQDVEAIYKDNDYDNLAARMHECSASLGFAWSDDADTGESKLKLRQARFCKVRHCPVCMWRRSMKNSARFFAALPDLRAAYPTAKFLFLTLTVPNCKFEDLRSTVAEMNTGWKRLIQRKDWPAIGFVRSVEVTKEENRSGYCHPHFHVLLMVPASYFSRGYITQAKWLEMWQDAMRDPTISQVDIRTVKPKIEGAGSLESAILETLKYGTKVSDLFDPDFLICLTKQLHKMRFLSSGGVLKDILKEELSDAEMIEGEGEGEAEAEPSLFFGWKRDIKRYKKAA